MLRFGLTGGIATGKSTVAQLFRDRGVPVIDADRLAREVVAPDEPALAEIAARFAGAIDPAGRLNRKKLGDLVFGNATELQALNAIVHPRVAERALQIFTALEQQGERLAIYDVPLLFENGLERGMDGTIVVTCSPETQLKRLMQRDQLSESAARARIDAQMPLAEKEKKATWLIDNNGTIQSLSVHVQQLMEKVGAWKRSS